MLKLLLTKDSLKFLDGLPAKQFRQIMLRALNLLDNPRPPDSKPLTGYPFWRNDIGEYRIVYDVHGDTLRILVVGKRNDSEVYKDLKNKRH
jgi:mRNA interferase RelE/StbE